ncbi:MAG: methyltransferase domain-containing protein, partial [Pseudomonadota bacterium]
MDKDFYLALENQFRGSKQLIRDRLAVYNGSLMFLKDMFKDRIEALDLGCGRGEWLETLRDSGIECSGVDTDANMVAACTELGFEVLLSDAIDGLRAKRGSSLNLISAFHVIEHIPFSQLSDLVAEAFRVLKPGGVLILETPNPENLVVGSCNFYIDPTHIKPIPPPLLDFLVRYKGFEETVVLRLQHETNLENKANVLMRDVLRGCSPDYGIVAKKPPARPVTKKLEEFQKAHKGITTNDLSQRYDSFIERRFSDLIERIESVSGSHVVNNLLEKIDSLQDRVIVAQSKFTIVSDKLEEAQEKYNQRSAELLEVKNLLSSAEEKIKTLQVEPKLGACANSISACGEPAGTG